MSSLTALPESERIEVIKDLGDEHAYGLLWDWEFHARPDQLLPEGDWTYWLTLAGRGWGKTRVGAETVRIWAKSYRYVNLIGATTDDARDIMIEGESGIMSICPPDERPEYIKGARKLVWPNGCVSLIFTADEPERLRGKQHEKLWGDELAAWRYPEAWDQAKFGLRLGDNPQAILTTTPRPTKLMRELVKDPHCHVTRGSTYDNKQNLAPSFFSQIIKKYEGTRRGRQELLAELLEDTPGALWQRKNIDEHRIPIEDLPVMTRIVVAVDPAISSEDESNETGIVVAGICENKRGYVLAEESGIFTPDEWGKRVASLFHTWDADRIIAEKNQGGEMVEHVIKSALSNAPVKLVHASRGKVTRAEPTSALYEQGRISHVGVFVDLEDQMVAFTSDFDRKAQGYSPDKVDALVWAFTDLLPLIIKKKQRATGKAQPKQRFF